MDDRQVTRRLLWQWGATVDRVRRMQDEIRGLQTLIDGVHNPYKGKQITGMPAGTGTGDPTARAAERAMEIIAAYTETADSLAQQIKDALRIKRLIDEIVADLTPVQAQILELRYQKMHGWEYIALKMSYAERLVRLREADAVDAISEKLSLAPA